MEVDKDTNQPVVGGGWGQDLVLGATRTDVHIQVGQWEGPGPKQVDFPLKGWVPFPGKLVLFANHRFFTRGGQSPAITVLQLLSKSTHPTTCLALPPTPLILARLVNAPIARTFDIWHLQLQLQLHTVHCRYTVWPTPLNPQKKNWPDTFEVEVADEKLLVWRVDINKKTNRPHGMGGGWAQDLVFGATAGPSTPLSLQSTPKASPTKTSPTKTSTTTGSPPKASPTTGVPTARPAVALAVPGPAAAKVAGSPPSAPNTPASPASHDEAESYTAQPGFQLAAICTAFAVASESKQGAARVPVQAVSSLALCSGWDSVAIASKYGVGIVDYKTLCARSVTTPQLMACRANKYVSSVSHRIALSWRRRHRNS
jgi:hypothetical protein